jgi:hypothetical protein
MARPVTTNIKNEFILIKEIAVQGRTIKKYRKHTIVKVARAIPVCTSCVST